jgi:cobyric acid synthase
MPTWGCYLHGIFDSPDVRDGLVRWLRARRGLAPQAPSQRAPEAAPDPLDRLADWLESHCDPVSLAGEA